MCALSASSTPNPTAPGLFQERSTLTLRLSAGGETSNKNFAIHLKNNLATAKVLDWLKTRLQCPYFSPNKGRDSNEWPLEKLPALFHFNIQKE